MAEAVSRFDELYGGYKEEFLAAAEVSEDKHIVRAGGLEAHNQGDGVWHHMKGEMLCVSRFCPEHMSEDDQIAAMKEVLAKDAAGDKALDEIYPDLFS